MSLLLLCESTAFPAAPLTRAAGYFFDGGTACHRSNLDLMCAVRIHNADAGLSTACAQTHHPVGGQA
jgi:hypothetical protein